MDLTGARWRKSSHSSAQGQCVEVATNFPEFSAIRDSKDPQGHVLVLAEARFADFIHSLRSGGFDG
ncbi:DUF397 domain-containing protein [Saccharopolyspora sp. NFXS83]|uniref:DUF397 domain-containing protein n=1 Tax=Saccharopolyspora sp. NFXS83 TaxID=2993560 RepID=UPI00224B636C|nr:DUF397 domain-containing protein [Saccharopolyspora sp. NFXS83]MCX2734287.1 DUF397 domain-containing protein [Saccharopolyspora sp. NFXS83]